MLTDWQRYGGPTPSRPASRWWCLPEWTTSRWRHKPCRKARRTISSRAKSTPAGCCGALRYAVERKAMEEALFVEKERAQVTLNCIGDAVACTDSLGQCHLPQPWWRKR